LQALGMVRGPKFDDIVEKVFAIQLTGRGKTVEEREKILRKLSGIKEAPKKKEKEKKPGKGAVKTQKEGAVERPALTAAAAKAHHKERLGAGKHGPKPVPPAAHGKSAGKKQSGRK